MYLCPNGSQRRAPNIIKNCQSRLLVDPGPGLWKCIFQMQVLLQHRTSGKGLPKGFLALQASQGHVVDGSPPWTLYCFQCWANTTQWNKRTPAGKHTIRNKQGNTGRRTSSESFCSNIEKLDKITGNNNSRTLHYNLFGIFRGEACYKKVFRGNHYPMRIKRA